MAVYHAKTSPAADWTGTVTVFNSQGSSVTIPASSLILPSDHNSAHNQLYTLSGNTAVQSTASGTNVVFQGLGNITLAGSTGTVGISGHDAFQLSGNTSNASTVSGTNVVFQGLGGITMVGSTGTVGISAAAHSSLATFEPVPWNGVSTNQVAVPNATSSPVTIWPFVIPAPLNAGILNLAFSASFVTVGTSSGRQTMGFNVGLYQRGSGTNSTRLESITSQQIQYFVTGNNSSYSIRQFTSTAYSGYGGTGETNSGGVNITSQYTGLKKIGVPINSYLSPGQYYLAMQGTNSTSSVNVGISLSWLGNVIATQASAFAPMGSLSSAYTAGSNPVGGPWREGYGSWSSAGSVTQLPSTINFTSISNGNNSVQPHMRFWST